MVYQIKADFYKLIHSKLVYIIALVVGLIFLLFAKMAYGSGGYYMGFVTGNVHEVPVVQGFLGFIYVNKAKPMTWEIIYSCNALTSLLWIALMALTVQFYLKEYQYGTIKLSIAYGCNKTILFFSKLIVILIYFGILYYGFNIGALFFLSHALGVSVTGTAIINLLGLASLNLLVFVVLTIAIMLFCTLVKNSVVVSIVTVGFMFSMIFMLISVLSSGSQTMPLIINMIFHLNPMYYLWRASGYWSSSNIVLEIVLFFIIGTLILSEASYLLLKNQELK